MQVSQIHNTPRKTKTEVQFTATWRENKTIGKITARAVRLLKSWKAPREAIDIHMDIEATHCNGNPLRLDDLLKADDFNFAHDISGITNCLDRETGKLTRNFRPRFSKSRSVQ